MPKEPLVLIVILHWQGSDYTKACLTSLRALAYKNYKVILVDNGSPDNSGSAIAREFPEVTLLETGENLGFSGGCNAGINYCLENEAEWIWLLNNDTTVEPEALSLLVDVAQENSHAAALGAMVVTGQGEQFVTCGAGEIDFLRAKTYLRKTAQPGTQFISCDWLSGSNLLLKAEAIRQVGTFNDDYFLYFEDTDLCLRFRQSGWSCLFVPAARVQHTGCASTSGARSHWRAYYYTRNRLLFFASHTSGLARLPGLINIGGHLLRHAIVLPLRGKTGRKQLKAELLGLKDYLNGRVGKATCLDWCESAKG